MRIGGLQAITLLDFPGKVACTIFTKACNFRCHFCHNPELVLPEMLGTTPDLSEEDFWKFLDERRDFLDAVCISGGEPTMQADLPDFISRLKARGLAVKLDTNGTNMAVLKGLLDANLLDYVAMDIKQLPEKYSQVVNAPVDVEQIKASVDLLRSSNIPYEFRTTVLGNLMTEEDILGIAEWLAGSRVYHLQHARTNRPTLNSDYHLRPNELTLSQLKDIHQKIVDKFEICTVR